MMVHLSAAAQKNPLFKGLTRTVKQKINGEEWIKVANGNWILNKQEYELRFPDYYKSISETN